ncbi:hypothetical protein NE237_029902 [Protea cynaroides]|uniref:Phytocyanin domain-containing protein n=1 Tax=Protea cynaroides TaxID=273540 RepID=A0A9Q0GT64_9MAGN|nr:hypothetical protein NE237_029902 [Protea cynaroides]
MDVASGLLILLLVAPAVCAVEYIVGGSQGWDLNVDYQTWLSGKTFYAGDILLFQYGTTHSVDTVNSIDYDNCTTSSPLKSHKSGNDSIILSSTGPMYFICPTTYHCNEGMKFAVNVLASNSTSATPTTPPSSSPSSSPTTGSKSPAPPNLCNINALVLGLGISLIYYTLMS